MTRVLITGVRGKTGAALARHLVAEGATEVDGGSTDPARIEIDGVRPVRFDWDDPSGWASAVEAVDALYLMRPDLAAAPELIRDLIAQTPPAARVTLLSEQGAGSFPAGHWALRAEQAVHRGDRPWTVLRPSWFMQVFTDERYYRADLAERATLAFPAGGARLAWIDARDIAAVAAHTLLDGAHDRRTYELTGPAALDLPSTAALLSTAIGRPVTHVDQPVAEAVTGLTGFAREQFAETFERVRSGVFAEITDDVSRVTGRPARSLEQFASEPWDGTDRP